MFILPPSDHDMQFLIACSLLRVVTAMGMCQLYRLRAAELTYRFITRFALLLGNEYSGGDSYQGTGAYWPLLTS